MKKLLIVLSILFSLNINAQNNSLAGDVNCDSIVNSVDASLILQYITGILDSLPCEPSAQTIINFMSGSGGGGCDYNFPEGRYGDIAMIDLINNNTYTVPTGKNFYITSSFRDAGNATITLGGSVFSK